MAERWAIEVETEDAGIAERIYMALCAKIEPWLHCKFTARLVDRSPKPKAKADGANK